MIDHGPHNPELPLFDDDVLKEMYIEYDTPCDSLVSDHSTLLSFAEGYVERTGQQVELSQLARRLLALRKLGETKGGLPRLRRTYNGRS
jgi:hypothetical protein